MCTRTQRLTVACSMQCNPCLAACSLLVGSRVLRVLLTSVRSFVCVYVCVCVARSGVNIDGRDQYGYTPLMSASERGLVA